MSSDRIALFFNANANGALIDLGSYNLGGWIGYCIGPNMKSSGALENAENVHLKIILMNGQSNSAHAMVDVQFVFTPGGYVEKNIDVVSFPIWHLDDHSTVDEIFYAVIMFVICLVVPVLILFQQNVMFFWDHRKLSWRTKFYFFWSWMMVPVHLYGLLFLFFGVCCAASSLVSFQKFQTFNFQFGEKADLTTPDVFISKTIEATVLMEQGIRSVEVIHAMYFVTVLVGLVFLLQLMGFHKRLALVKEVLGGAVQDLIHFAVVFIIVLVVIAMICTVLFGRYSENFNTLQASLIAMLRIGLGDPGDFYDEILNMNAYTFIGPVMVCCIQMLIGLVLLNIVISICCDAFAAYEEGFDRTHYWGVADSFLCYITRKYLRVKQHFCTDLGFERRGNKKWQDLFCAIFAKTSGGDKRAPNKTIAFSVALHILETSPCGRYYAKLALAQVMTKQILEEPPKEREQSDSSINADSPSEIHKLKLDNAQLKSDLKDAHLEIKKLNKLLHNIHFVPCSQKGIRAQSSELNPGGD